MRVIQLQAENIKRLVAIDITPEGDMVKISGANAAGKSSVLDSIMYALGGMDVIQSKPVRNGKKNGFVRLDLGDLVVERRFTNEGKNSTLTVTSKDGEKFSSPQSVINKLLGRMTFDPLEYMRMDPKGQNDTLREMLGLDFTELDSDRKKMFDHRTELNRELKSIKAQREAINYDPKGALEETNSVDLLKKYNEAKEANTVIEKAQDELDETLQQIEETTAEIEALKKQLKALNDSVPDLKAAAAVEPFDLKALSTQIENLDKENRNARAFDQAKKLDDQIKLTQEKADQCTLKIEAIDKDKMEMIAMSDMPVEGLTFGDNEVLYNGLPVNQASSAEQLRISVAMAMAMNPKIRVLRITDGSLLDSASMKLIEEMAGKNDYQVWMEVVDESGKVGIVIEDGMVKDG